MGMSIGIVGMPNAGKSTIFNALSRKQTAEAASYPFCTIEPNRAVTPVPDERLEAIADIVHPESVEPATVVFVDIAGLVRGAHAGEGLGNTFLSHARECDGILHAVRCFEDENVAHVEGSLDVARDVELIDTELLLADLQTVANRVDKLSRQARADKSLRQAVSKLEELQAHLEAGKPAMLFDASTDEVLADELKELRLLTAKPVIFCANVDETGLEGDEQVAALRKIADARGAPVMLLCAKMEEELGELGDEDRREFLQAFGIEESGLDKIIRAGYEALQLISFFTTLSNKLRAWTLRRGCRAPQAAGTIHTDFEQGFIRAHITSIDDFVRYGSEAECRAAGAIHEEGRDYEVQDGDVIHFHFSS